VELKLYMI